MVFPGIFGSRKIEQVDGTDCIYHVCWGRADTEDEDVTNREDMSKKEASRAVALWLSLNAADGSRRVSYEDLLFWKNVRVFFFTEKFGTECSCRAFIPNRQCFHQLALDLRAGRVFKPRDVDFTPLAQKTKGRKAKAGDRYYVDENVQHVFVKLLTLAPGPKQPLQKTRSRGRKGSARPK